MKEQLHRARAAAAAIQPLMPPLAGWNIQVRLGVVDDAGPAYVYPLYEWSAATITLSPEWAERTDLTMLQLMAHELAHCVTGRHTRHIQTMPEEVDEALTDEYARLALTLGDVVVYDGEKRNGLEPPPFESPELAAPELAPLKGPTGKAKKGEK